MTHPARDSQYADLFRTALARMGRVDVPWQVAEACARSEWGTLGAKSERALTRMAAEAAACWDADPALCRKLAESYGMRVVAIEETR